MVVHGSVHQLYVLWVEGSVLYRLPATVDRVGTLPTPTLLKTSTVFVLLATVHL